MISTFLNLVLITFSQRRRDRKERTMRACDICGRKIKEESNNYCIKVKYRRTSVEYDSCSRKCAAMIFKRLAQQWNNNGDDQS